MPYRKTPFVNGQFYHVYNRGSEKRRIFEDQRDFKRFLKTLIYYQYKGPKTKFSNYLSNQGFQPKLTQKNVEIIAYCLIPNHFHLLIKQIQEGGITDMIKKISLSYTKYFNTKNNRVGPLFQGQFKAVLVETDEQLLHVSRYIHLNPLSALLVKKLKRYKWSSYEEYIDNKFNICSKNEILNFFGSHQSYKQFVSNQIEYAQSLELIKHQLIDKGPA